MKKLLLTTAATLILTSCLLAQSTTLTLPAANSSASFKVGNNSNAVLMRLNGDAGFYLGGTYGTGTIPASGAGTRLIWYPAKAAFRAGSVDGTQWDDNNIEVYSTAFGYNTTASGVASVAMGQGTTAGGDNSTAMGLWTTASGSASAAMGYHTKASGDYSTAMGYYTTASGNNSTAMGQNTTAQAFASTVIGQYNILSGTTNSWVDTDPLFVCGNGSSSSHRSNALTLYKNGNLTIAGQIKISGGAPGAGKVLTSDANGLATWKDITGSTNTLDDAYNNGSTITADAGPVAINGTDGLISTGTYGSGDTLTVSGPGTRMIWYPKKAAFRAGNVTGTQWDDDSIGNHSVAFGTNTIAKGSYSTVMGYSSTADGSGSVAIGGNVTASGTHSTAFGYYTTASGGISTAMGNNTTASGTASVVSGEYSKASGTASVAMGESAIADGDYSFAEGYYAEADGNYSFAAGRSATAYGTYSTAIGPNTTAQAYGSMAVGRFNTASGTTDSWVTTDQLFVVGNGTSSSNLSNALTLYKNGNMTIAGTLTQNSDIRLKKDITPLKNVLPLIEKITPIYYYFKDTKTHPAGKQIGFSAQEIQKEFPELVIKNSKGYLSVEYANMTAVLLEAVKEQNAELKSQNKKMKAEIAGQNERIALLEKNFKEMKTLIAGMAKK